MISASILSADFARLADDCHAVLKAGAGAIHFDVMDHHYVPNLSFGSMPCKALRNAGITAEIDVHLMVEKPEQYVDVFHTAGATRLTFHPETTDDPIGLIERIRQTGMEVGLAFNPDQAVHISDHQLADLDLVLLMSVFPGFGGQSFINSTYDKIRDTRQRLNRHHATTRLAVDGGINIDTIGPAAAAGANYFVVGSGLFQAADYAQRIDALSSKVNAHTAHTPSGDRSS